MENRKLFYCRHGLAGFLSVCVLLVFLKNPVLAADSFSVMEWNRELQALESLGRKAGNEIMSEQHTQTVTGQIPKSYDPRQKQMVTPVRDQGDLALCWDYAGIALMESALLIKGYRGADVDLSELHGAYATYHLQADGSSFSQFCRRTNTRTAVFEAALAGMGPVPETEVPMRQITDDFHHKPVRQCLRSISCDGHLGDFEIDDCEFFDHALGAVRKGKHAAGNSLFAFRQFCKQSGAEGLCEKIQHIPVFRLVRPFCFLRDNVIQEMCVAQCFCVSKKHPRMLFQEAGVRHHF